jgi:hypothetical protein
MNDGSMVDVTKVTFCRLMSFQGQCGKPNYMSPEVVLNMSTMRCYRHNVKFDGAGRVQADLGLVEISGVQQEICTKDWNRHGHDAGWLKKKIRACAFATRDLPDLATTSEPAICEGLKESWNPKPNLRCQRPSAAAPQCHLWLKHLLVSLIGYLKWRFLFKGMWPASILELRFKHLSSVLNWNEESILEFPFLCFFLPSWTSSICLWKMRHITCWNPHRRTKSPRQTSRQLLCDVSLPLVSYHQTSIFSS